MTKSIGKIGVALLLALLALGAAQPTAGPAHSPATQPADRAIAGDALDLGSTDFAVRMAATQRLWRAGVLAEPVLKTAASSENPEIVERASALLKYIEDGIVPSTSPAVIRLLEAYRQASTTEQQNAVIQQLSQAGTDGMRVLLRLREQSPPLDRVRLDSALAQSPRIAVALLLRENNRAEAESLLNWRMSEDDSVAYWLIAGQLRDRIALYRSEGESRLLSRVEWANGEAPAALRDARAGGNMDLVRRMLIVQAAWPALAREMQADAPQPSLAFEGSRALICRFAGDAAGADAIIGPIAEAIGPNHNRIGNPALAGDDRGAAAALCLNDRPSEAIASLLDAGMHNEAADLLQTQLRYKQMLALIDHADGNDPETIRMKAQFAGVFAFLGEPVKAAASFAEAADANANVHDLGIDGALCQSAVGMHRPRDVDAHLLDALTHSAGIDGWSFDMANIPTPDDAALWWNALRDRQDAKSALRSIEAVANHDATDAEAAQLANIVDAWSQTQPVEEQPSIVRSIVTAMKAAGAPAEQIAARIAAHADASPSVELFLALGEFQADRRQWPAAAEAYGRAVDIDPARPLSAFLHGWAMTRAGAVKAGRAEMDLAHLLPLGDVQLRLDLFNAARGRGLFDDAERERKIMLAIGDPSTVPMTELLRRCAADAEKRGNYSAAAQYCRQELAGRLSASGQYNEDQFVWSDLPGNIHRLNALSDFAGHKPDIALAEAMLSYKDRPDDVDGLITLIRFADSVGASRQADALFEMGHETYQSLCRDYPDSAGLHNQLAWAETRTRRNLNDALAHAKRAVELQPTNTASLDTLAETHYQLHQFQSATDTIEKCIKLEPNEPHHRKQLARFQLALKTGVADKD